MGRSVMRGDGLHVEGELTADTTTLSSGAVVNASVSASAAIAATKVQQQYLARSTIFSGSVAAGTEIIHVPYGSSCTVSAVRYMIRTAPSGSDSYKIDVQESGVSILSSTIGVTSATVTGTIATGTVSDSSIATGAPLTVVISSGSGSSWGTGLFVQVPLRETSGT